MGHRLPTTTVSLLCSEEKAKLLREVMAKIEDKNEVLE